MNKLETALINKCRMLRESGYSIGGISSVTGLAKSTIYGYVKDILLNFKQKKEIEIRNRERNRNKVNPRKGKCLPGREITMPKAWSDELVHMVAHFMFDGRIGQDSCIYYSKDMYQIMHMRQLLGKLFKISPRIQRRDNGVYGLVFYHVELAEYMRGRRDDLFHYLNNGASALSKSIFLQAFFDDEGNVYFRGDKRRVRGYQKSRERLNVIQNLLRSFEISGTINKEGTYIEIAGKENFFKFSREINFSPKIYMNPKRKNSMWRKPISKRDILNLAIQSYAA